MKIIQIVDLLKNKLVRIEEIEGLEVGDFLLVQNERDRIVAKLLSPAREVPNVKIDKNYKFIAKLSESEKKKFEDQNKDVERRLAVAQSVADELKLPMRFFYSFTDFDNKVFSFFFVSEEQVDFREFLTKVSKKLNKRIHLKRVGSRDKAKMLGGFGPCGRSLCCSTWKENLESVPLNSARDQNLITRFNDKLFGLCGKLKCCLMYELPHYREMRKYLPHIRQKVMAEGREGKVVGLDILNQKVKVIFEDGGLPEVYHIDDIVVGDKKSRTVSQRSSEKSK